MLQFQVFVDLDPELESHAKEPELESLGSGSALDLNPPLEWAAMPMKSGLIVNSSTFPWEVHITIVILGDSHQSQVPGRAWRCRNAHFVVDLEVEEGALSV